MKLLYKGLLIALVAMVCNMGMAQVPDKPANMAPIVDMAGIINNDSLVNALNTRLDSLSRRTTNQIVVVTVNDLGKLEANQFATQLGRKWGIGDKKSNNGVVILVKPKNDKGGGAVFIEPGYGLEGALPDVKCRYIIDSLMVPHFKDGDYASGIEEAVNYIEPIVLKEYEQAQAAASKSSNKKGGRGYGWWILGGIAAVIGGLSFLRKRNKKNLPQQPANDNDAETGVMAATGAATALAASTQDEPEPDDENNDEDNEEEDNKPNEPEPYKYKYGGGDFGGAGAGAKF